MLANNNKNNAKCDPKWTAIVDDQIIPMPRKTVTETILRQQTGIAEEYLIVRDHNSPDDEVLKRSEEIDLSKGNVFYTEKACDVESRIGSKCKNPSKLGFIVDDRWEIVVVPSQTTDSILELFGLKDVELVRDYESPVDESVPDDEKFEFSDGPVFITRKCKCGLEIIVNRKRFNQKDGVKSSMTGEQIARLITEQPEKTDVYKITGGRRKIELSEEIKICDLDEFEVIRRDVSGGFNLERVTQEIERFQDGGGKIELLPEIPAVIYKAVPAHAGAAAIDVLVVIPDNYPSQMLDCAFLPNDSSFLDSTVGVKQEAMQAGGRTWVKKSYHPHNGGGGAPWNPARHGIHTYYDELLPWLIIA
jgi:hypothetical protein